MGEFLDKLADWLNLERFVDMFRDNEEFIMTKGLRIIAVGSIIIAVVYAVQAFFQFKNL